MRQQFSSPMARHFVLVTLLRKTVLASTELQNSFQMSGHPKKSFTVHFEWLRKVAYKCQRVHNVTGIVYLKSCQNWIISTQIPQPHITLNFTSWTLLFLEVHCCELLWDLLDSDFCTSPSGRDYGHIEQTLIAQYCTQCTEHIIVLCCQKPD